APIGMLYPDQSGIGTLVIPNTVALVAGAPNPENARRLIDYLLSPEVEAALAAGPSHQIPLHPGLPTPSGTPRLATLTASDVAFARIAPWQDEVDAFLKSLFQR